MGTLDAKAIDLYELYGLPAGYTFTANCRIQDVNLQSAQPSAVLRQEGHLVEASVPESIAAALSGTLTIESYVRVCGNVVEDLRTNTRSTVDSAAVLLNSLDVISAAVPDLPGRLLCHTSSAETSKAQLNGTHMNLRLDHRILDLRNASNSAVAKILSATHQLATQHVAEEGYHWVSTPTLIDYQLPGDNDYFEVPYMHGITARLAQSSEMHLGMALAADMERVYDIHTSFRREPNTSTRHLTEVCYLLSQITQFSELILQFTMIEACFRMKETWTEYIDGIEKLLVFLIMSLQTQDRYKKLVQQAS